MRRAPAALRRILGFLEPVRRDFWPYLVAPPLLTAVFVGFEETIPLAMAPHLLRDTTIFVVCIGLPLHLVYANFGERLGLATTLRLRDVPIQVGLIGAAVLLGTELAFAILGALHGEPLEHDERFPSRRAVWLMGFVGNALVTSLMVAFGRYRERLQEVELRALLARQESLAAQLQALQARIQPHFLFNSLNTVASLIPEDPQRAEAVVERLADLFRYTLDASKRPTVPLEEELAAVAGFLELESLRYGDRLKAALHADPGAGDVPVPPLVLQPLVENAVVHGIAPRREGGRLEVCVERRADALVLRVEDDGPGPGGSPRRGAGTALADLRQRLALLYGDRASLEVGAAALGGFRVEIALPLAPEAGPSP
jgi:two-component system sensor histidine kinase AlgZ